MEKTVEQMKAELTPEQMELVNDMMNFMSKVDTAFQKAGGTVCWKGRGCEEPKLSCAGDKITIIASVHWLIENDDSVVLPALNELLRETIMLDEYERQRVEMNRKYHERVAALFSSHREHTLSKLSAKVQRWIANRQYMRGSIVPA